MLWFKWQSSRKKLDSVVGMLKFMFVRQEKFMSEIKDALDKLTATVSTVESAMAQAVVDLQGLQKQVADLAAQVASGVEVTADDLNALNDGLTAAAANLTAAEKAVEGTLPETPVVG